MKIPHLLIGAAALSLAASRPGWGEAQPAPEPEAAVSFSPYVEPVLHEAIRLKGGARAVIRLREGASFGDFAQEGAPGSGAGRFAAAAALAQGALEAAGASAGASAAGSGLRPLGGDLRVAEVSAAQLRALAESGAAAEIYLDRLTSVAFDRLSPSPAPPLPGAAQAQGREEPAEDPPPEPSASGSPSSGAPSLGPPPSGPAAAVIDTGVDADHPYIRGLVVRQACFSSTVAADRATTLCPNGRAAQTLGEAARPCDPEAMGPLCGHGTKVAGLISGRGGSYLGPDGEARALEGIAPGAPILAI